MKRVILSLVLCLAVFFGTAGSSWATPLTVYSVEPTFSEAMDWPDAEHSALNAGDYLYAMGWWFYVYESGPSYWNDPGTYNYAKIQYCNVITGEPLYEPLDPGTPFSPGSMGMEGQEFEHYTSWPGPQETWTVETSTQPSLAGDTGILWSYLHHGKLAQGDYVTVGVNDYYVVGSDYCTGGEFFYCPGGSVWADLQQVNLVIKTGC